MDWFERDFDLPSISKYIRTRPRMPPWKGRAWPICSTWAGQPGTGPALRLGPPASGPGRGRLRVIGGDSEPVEPGRHRGSIPGPCARLDLRRLPFRDQCCRRRLCALPAGATSPREEEPAPADRVRPGAASGRRPAAGSGRPHPLPAGRAPGGAGWYPVAGLYQERVRRVPTAGGVLTERICRGERFRHDIWIPTDREAREALAAAGLGLDQAFGGLGGEPLGARGRALDLPGGPAPHQ